jgi:hypothetical protein
MLVEKKKDGRLVGFLNCPLGSSQRERLNLRIGVYGLFYNLEDNIARNTPRNNAFFLNNA